MSSLHELPKRGSLCYKSLKLDTACVSTSASSLFRNSHDKSEIEKDFERRRMSEEQDGKGKERKRGSKRGRKKWKKEKQLTIDLMVWLLLSLELYGNNKVVLK